jgi:K+-sensing histidine kinase KdpD
VFAQYSVSVTDMAPLIGAAPLLGSGTDGHAAERHVRLLAQASLKLRDTSDAKCGLADVARLVVPALADWAAIDLVDERGRTSRVAAEVAETVPSALRVALQKRHFPSVIKDAECARTMNHRSRYLRRLLELGLASMIVAPLRSRRRLFGSIAFGTTQSNHHLGPWDLAVADNLATLCAVALDNSRLCRIAAQAIAARDEFLRTASHELRTPLSHVKGFVSTLRRRDVLFEAEAREDFLAEVEREADRLADVIDALVNS